MDDFDERLQSIKDGSGSIPISDLLEQIAKLEQDCRAAPLTNYAAERYQAQLQEVRGSLTQTQRRKFRFDLSEPGEAAAGTRERMPVAAPAPASAPTVPRKFNQTISGSHLENLENCTIVSDSQSLLVSNAAHCTIIANCHQVRLHQCMSCTVYASCTRPVIEKSSDMQFGYIEGEPEWEAVDDFDWLRPGPSPNWRKATPLLAAFPRSLTN